MTELLKREMLAAIEAAESKKAENLTILEMDRSAGAFTDYFIICNGTNPRQMQSIADEIELQVKRQTGTYAHQVEGYREAEWILVDYVDFVFHIFSEERRAFYGLERLWRSAKSVTPQELASASPDQDTISPEPDAMPTTRRSAKRVKPAKAAAVRAAAKKSARAAKKATKAGKPAKSAKSAKKKTRKA